jgi:hypothetical protein
VTRKESKRKTDWLEIFRIVVGGRDESRVDMRRRE